MSGICGWISWDRAPISEHDLQPMLDVVSYRGPDGVATWSQDGAALGHLALRITPESQAEIQPLVDQDAGLVLVADARIDNRDELIPLLRAKAALTDARPADAALILAAYRTWGEACLEHLVGDFAFAIWDRHRRRLLLARDPMGLRSVYFRAEPDRFLFATEARQILAAPGVPEELFLPSVASFLVGDFGRPEWTFFAGVERLQPGRALVVEAARSRLWRFWAPDPAIRIRYRSEDQYVDHFLDLWKTAVRSRLRSTRPAGLLLSGGVDSGAIAAMAGWLRANEPDPGAGPLRAYCWAWDELTECDERHISGPLAAHCGLPVTEIAADDAWPLHPGADIPVAEDSPFLFGHYVILGRTFDQARDDGMGLVLSGDRGDLVAGMYLYDLPYLLRTGRWRTLVNEMRTLARWSGCRLRAVMKREVLMVVSEAALFHRRIWGSLPPFRRYTEPAARDWPDWITQELIGHALDVPVEAWLEPFPAFPSRAARQRYRMIFTPLHMLGLEASERMHARRAQAFADPWSDRRIAAFACQVPQRVFNRVGDPKRLTRQALARLVPPGHVQAMQKVVPTPLFDRGLRQRARQRVEAMLQDSHLARLGFVHPGPMLDAYRGICGRTGDNPAHIWQALALELWLRDRPGESGNDCAQGE
jgi:asparagine synthase (glutamine-hydrolysing)